MAVASTVQIPDALDILQSNCLTSFKGVLDNSFRYIMNSLLCSVLSSPAILCGKLLCDPRVIPLERTDDPDDSLCNSHRVGKVVLDYPIIIASGEIPKIPIDPHHIIAFQFRNFTAETQTELGCRYRERADCYVLIRYAL